MLGVSRFATTKMIPALKHCELCEVAGIASRDAAKAKRAAAEFGIAKFYGSYEEMLADPEIKVIYNPLPNHLHVPSACARGGGREACAVRENSVALSAAARTSLPADRDEGPYGRQDR